MSIINNSHEIGVDTRNLVLKTRGSLYVKVGDRYYEIDFRNLGKTEKEDEEKEEFIITIDSKDEIETIDYPGDNKLIVGLDGTLFVTKGSNFIDITPKQTIQTSQVETITQAQTSIDSLLINNMLLSTNTMLLDFANSEITTDVLTVNREVNLPSDSIKNRCCRTYIEDSKVNTKYMDMDFIEIINVPEYLVVKSGVIIKSHTRITIPVYIGNDAFNESCVFEAGGLYIIYLDQGEVIQTRLN